MALRRRWHAIQGGKHLPGEGQPLAWPSPANERGRY